MKFSFALIAFLVASLNLTFASEFILDPAEGNNWCKLAERYVFDRSEGTNFDCETDGKEAARCVRMNNYGCVKHYTSTPYLHTPNLDGINGAHDGDDKDNPKPHFGHAIFDHPKHGFAAKIEWFKRNYDQGYISAVDLIDRYSPWCDPKGSKPTRTDNRGVAWGTTCNNSRDLPIGFNGPLCQKPSNGTPKPHQCEACNCPTDVMADWLKGTGYKPTDAFPIFDQNGNPTDLLEQTIRRQAKWEIGEHYTDALVKEGFEEYYKRYGKR